VPRRQEEEVEDEHPADRDTGRVDEPPGDRDRQDREQVEHGEAQHRDVRLEQRDDAGHRGEEHQAHDRPAGRPETAHPGGSAIDPQLHPEPSGRTIVCAHAPI
jgi:hypothetical protein